MLYSHVRNDIPEYLISSNAYLLLSNIQTEMIMLNILHKSKIYAKSMDKYSEEELYGKMHQKESELYQEFMVEL